MSIQPAEVAKVAAWSTYFARLCERRGWMQGGPDWESARPAQQWPAWLEQAVQAQAGVPDDEASLTRALRRVRQEAQARFIFRELSGRVDVAASCAEISAFAQACLHYVWTQLGRWYGLQDWSVLGLGKLGGGELNLSSDIDLIFVAADDADLEACIRQGQALIRVLDAVTAEGRVFRVDMRLRPWGEGSALMASVTSMERYYEQHGRDWERYALVKARVVAGARAPGGELLQRLRPFVFRRYRDYGAYAALRRMKALIEGEQRRRGLGEDIKLGPGGIREVEFIVQLFQLLHAGSDQRLQTTSLLAALQTVEELALLPSATAQDLCRAYLFLRRLEHALQAREDQQTQTLPAVAERAALAEILDYASADALERALSEQRARVHAIFVALVQKPAQPNPVGERYQSYFALPAELAGGALGEMGFIAVAAVDQGLRALLTSRTVSLLTREAAERLQAFLPALLQAASRSAQPDLAVLRLLPLVEAVLRRSVYLAMLLEVPGHLERLCAIAIASPWVADELARYPALLDEFLAAEALRQPPTLADLRQSLAEALLRCPEQDQEALLEVLRFFKKSQVLQIALADQAQGLSLMQVSDALSRLAEVILTQAATMAYADMRARYGDCADFQRRTMIIAYGKLGGLEMSYSSDLDLVFVHDLAMEAVSQGPVVLDAATYVARWAQKLISILQAPMATGKLYEVDVRLRPSGHAGLLVTSWTAYQLYQQEHAWIWEHQALIRARPVWGDATLHDAFIVLRAQLLMRQREEGALAQAVAQMRQKMLSEGQHRPHHDDADDRFFIKHDRGGIVDIEFMVQYSVLAWSCRDPELTWYTDNVRLLERLAARQFLRAQDAIVLRDAYLAFRAAQHRQALAQGPDFVAAADWSEQRAAVRRLWHELIEQRAAAQALTSGEVKQ